MTRKASAIEIERSYHWTKSILREFFDREIGQAYITWILLHFILRLRWRRLISFTGPYLNRWTAPCLHSDPIVEGHLITSNLTASILSYSYLSDADSEGEREGGLYEIPPVGIGLA